MTKITCWYRQNIDTRGYYYNHYEEGWSIQKKPSVKHDTQNGWLQSNWLSEHTYINEGVIQ